MSLASLASLSFVIQETGPQFLGPRVTVRIKKAVDIKSLVHSPARSTQQVLVRFLLSFRLSTLCASCKFSPERWTGSCTIVGAQRGQRGTGKGHVARIQAVALLPPTSPSRGALWTSGSSSIKWGEQQLPSSYRSGVTRNGYLQKSSVN